MSSLPSSEYKVTFSDETVTMLSVHPDEQLQRCLKDMLQAAGKSDDEVRSVELVRTFFLEDEHSELLE